MKLMFHDKILNKPLNLLLYNQNMIKVLRKTQNLSGTQRKKGLITRNQRNKSNNSTESAKMQNFLLQKSRNSQINVGELIEIFYSKVKRLDSQCKSRKMSLSLMTRYRLHKCQGNVILCEDLICFHQLPMVPLYNLVIDQSSVRRHLVANQI